MAGYAVGNPTRRRDSDNLDLHAESRRHHTSDARRSREGRQRPALSARWPLLLSGGRDGRVLLWHPRQHKGPIGRVSGASPVNTVVWRPNDRDFAVGTEDGTLSLVVLPDSR